MKALKILIFCLVGLGFLSGCGETWSCQTKGKTMFSMSESGKIGAADKGCSCDQIRSFELKEFGRVDEQALKDDFGC